MIQFNPAQRAKQTTIDGYGLSHRDYLRALRGSDDETVVARADERIRARRWLEKWLRPARA